jgi:hypothetical protein
MARLLQRRLGLAFPETIWAVPAAALAAIAPFQMIGSPHNQQPLFVKVVIFGAEGQGLFHC